MNRTYIPRMPRRLKWLLIRLFRGRFDADCFRWRGRILTGKYKHYCYEWDFLPVDESTPEWDCCTCWEPPSKSEAEGSPMALSSGPTGPHRPKGGNT